ncbi:MAG: 2-oxoacid:acceptor oxidoreductase family protein [Nanoarchaeota archaeon]|nr:2-oxoacid:acceptor oxidoreductase family protein [Nanoarchaeota archaeon]MBU1704638.1 2-oxoacid:acceptor oxidoreductase family protein [Nanoarchaeota archaeon]
MKDDIKIAGHGGQGVVLAGSLIANAAMDQGLETCGMVSYGAEMRGGTANATVIISDKPIGSPVVVNPTTALILNEPSLKKFEESLVPGGIIIINTSECKKKVSRTDLEVVLIPATEIASELGNKKATNMVMIGAYIKKRGIIDIQVAIKTLKRVLGKKPELVEINQKALIKGAEQCM